MGQRHLDSINKYLVTEAKGKYRVVKQVRYEEDKKHDQRFTLVYNKLFKVIEAAHLTIRSLPGCCGVCLIHSFKGETKEVIKFINIAIRAAKRAKYGQLIFTLSANSTILENFTDGETSVRRSFLNGKTGNRIMTVILDIEQEVPKTKDTEGE